MSEGARLVVCAPQGDGDLLELPGSRVDPDLVHISGGERSLYELAVAAASVGIEVELRGRINGPILDTLAAAAGAAPVMGLEPRRPVRGDVVVIPEVVDPILLAAVAMSDATWVMNLLAPPGLWGWSFLPGWQDADPQTVEVGSIGRPETFQAIAAFGFDMWTNAQGTAEAGLRAGCDVTWIGTGTPVPFPDPPAKTHDLAIVNHNRWSGLAARVAAEVAGATLLDIPPLESIYSLSDHLGPARVLVWPSRIEGMSRISREARAVGTVPVALDTNPFATREDHGGGVVLVADLDAMVKEIRALLADSPRLQRLATEAAVSARTQAAWGAFCSRVAAAFTHVSERPGRPHGYAIGAVGAHVHGRLETTRIEHDAAVAARLEHISHLESRIAQLENESEALRARLRSAEAATAAYQARRVVRLADALSPGRLTSVRVSRAGRAATPPDSALSTTPSWSAAGPARATEPDSDRPGDDLVAG